MTKEEQMRKIIENKLAFIKQQEAFHAVKNNRYLWYSHYFTDSILTDILERFDEIGV